MIWKPKEIFRLISQIQAAGLSMRRRFSLYLLTLATGFLMLLLLLLNLFGVLDLTSSRLEQTIEAELKSSVFAFESDMDKMAAYAISLSEQLSDETGRFLSRQDMDFDDLTNDIDLLNELQLENYSILYTYLQLADCSGAFYFLDTTVNDSLPDRYYNGIYLKLTNLYSPNTARKQSCVLYGAAAVSVAAGSDLYNAWQFELQENVFPEIDAIFRDPETAHPFMITPVYALADTWEQMRLLCVPIYDDQRCIGVCGFELSDRLFQLLYQTDSTILDNLCFALLSPDGESCTVQIAGSRSGYSVSNLNRLTVEPDKRFEIFRSEDNTFIGKSTTFSAGSSELTAAILLSESIYQSMIRSGRLKLIVFLLIVFILVACSCIITSRKYVEPLLRGIETLKAGEPERPFSRLPEINDLIVFLAEKDREHEKERDQLHRQYLDTQSEYQKLQQQMSRLTAQRQREVDPESYTLFKANLKTLTPKEREVFELYLQGKTSREIILLMGFTENALKFHNKNIYSKLGITSRKELLMYAALLERESTD